MNDLEQLLENTADDISISETAYTLAEKRYKSIGEWLERDESSLRELAPDVYTQGSFALGTVIKPLSNNEDYDIDLVCHLKAKKSQYTQEQIKDLVGKEMQKYAKAKDMSNKPYESRRCWTMEYASTNNQAGFHLDVLPSISPQSYCEAKQEFQNNQNFNVFEVNITDNEKENYSEISDDWYVSTPKGYAEWFDSRQGEALDFAKNILIAQYVEHVTRHAIKTPLQKTIQLLKRHRDVYFQNNNEVAPISIIITTLVAHTYNYSQKSIYAIITNFLSNYQKHIFRDQITNPVNLNENFADKWQKSPEKKEAFMAWMTKLQNDFCALSQLDTREEISLRVNNLFNKSNVNELCSARANNYPVAIDYNVSHRKILEYPEATRVSKVRITAKYMAKCRGFMPRTFSSGQPLKKHQKLIFKVNDKHVRGSEKEYYWQVVNTGDEAIREHNQPRGDFYKGERKRGGRTRVEDTAYIGDHWVQCFIVQNGQCTAKSDPFVVKIVRE